MYLTNLYSKINHEIAYLFNTWHEGQSDLVQYIVDGQYSTRSAYPLATLWCACMSI
jgi:hypothetical protein